MSMLSALLMLHLLALILMAGTTFIDFINYRMFWKLFNHRKEQAAGILSASAKFPRLIGIGAGFLIITGVGMIAVTHGVWAQQIWFRIKMILVLLLILNGIFNGNRLSAKLRAVISGNVPDLAQRLLNLKGKLLAFHLLQFAFLLLIIFLSAYKFN
ncbi:hypothetical protein [Chitinophaga sp.]|uniref:hypothetical protein n=1 Tax=Chitinophaga sp. TaxID=1869181 RepID=UPI002CE7E7CF|nr:hypothetical protein [Chitinophaga sp.]HWV68310.1 hypothetical protein [Chitinophaga sp.]